MPKAFMAFLWFTLAVALIFAAYDLFKPNPVPVIACKITSFSPYMQECN